MLDSVHVINFLIVIIIVIVKTEVHKNVNTD